MEIRCEKCKHVGPAAQLKPTAAGVALICSECGHPNLLDMEKESPPTEEAGSAAADGETGAPAMDVDTSDQSAAEADASPEGADTPSLPERAAPSPASSSQSLAIGRAIMERLVPEPGDGPRCPKCAHLQAPDEVNCARCGLSVADGRHYAGADAPWARPPEGLEAEHDQAILLWTAFSEDRTTENLKKFTKFVREFELWELGIRSVRFHLVDHPDDEEGVQALRLFSEGMQRRIVVAQTQVAHDIKQLHDSVALFKKLLLGFVILFFGSVLLILLSIVRGGV